MTDTAPEMSDRAPEYYGQPDDGLLTCVELNEAVEDFIDSLHGHPVPRTVTMYGYAAKQITDSKRLATLAIENLLEILDDNYGYTEEYSEPTPEMKAAAQVFVDAVIAKYTVRAVEPVTDAIEVDCVAWVAEHVPEWMDGIEWEDS